MMKTKRILWISCWCIILFVFTAFHLTIPSIAQNNENMESEPSEEASVNDDSDASKQELGIKEIPSFFKQILEQAQNLKVQEIDFNNYNEAITYYNTAIKYVYYGNEAEAKNQFASSLKLLRTSIVNSYQHKVKETFEMVQADLEKAKSGKVDKILKAEFNSIQNTFSQAEFSFQKATEQVSEISYGFSFLGPSIDYDKVIELYRQSLNDLSSIQGSISTLIEKARTMYEASKRIFDEAQQKYQKIISHLLFSRYFEKDKNLVKNTLKKAEDALAAFELETADVHSQKTIQYCKQVTDFLSNYESESKDAVKQINMALDKKIELFQ